MLAQRYSKTVSQVCPEELLVQLREVERKRLAWILALEAVSNETGPACITRANSITGGYADKILDAAEEE